jgi:serine/threonine protein phosphatase PrpC
LTSPFPSQYRNRTVTYHKLVRRIRSGFPESKFTSGGSYLRAGYHGHEILINMTRALGHKWLSKYGVTHTPSISFKTLTEDDAFVILASDGVWDNLTGHEAVMFVTDCIDEGEELSEVPKNLVEKSLEDVDSAKHRDNATAVVISF